MGLSSPLSRLPLLVKPVRARSHDDFVGFLFGHVVCLEQLGQLVACQVAHVIKGQAYNMPMLQRMLVNGDALRERPVGRDTRRPARSRLVASDRRVSELLSMK